MYENSYRKRRMEYNFRVSNFESFALPNINEEYRVYLEVEHYVKEDGKRPSRDVAEICITLVLGTQLSDKFLFTIESDRETSEDNKNISSDYSTEQFRGKRGILVANEGDFFHPIDFEPCDVDSSELENRFPELSIDELLEILGMTIKEDNVNKLITFFAMLSAYAPVGGQLNVIFNSPSGWGKTYIAQEIASLFPKEDITFSEKCSPTALFYDKKNYSRIEMEYYRSGEFPTLVYPDGKREFVQSAEGFPKNPFIDFSKKILIFLDQPHLQLLQNLRPLASHDKEIMDIKVTTESFETKSITTEGFPVIIFCSTGFKLDEQDATRYFLLSPENTPEKWEMVLEEEGKRESNTTEYQTRLESDPKRRLLKERIRYIKAENMAGIKIENIDKVQKKFVKGGLTGRSARDFVRLCSLIKCNALLNLWARTSMYPNRSYGIIANDTDIDIGFKIWDEIAESQVLGLPPYICDWYKKIIQPSKKGLSQAEIIKKHSQVCSKWKLEAWQLKDDIIPMLQGAGLITQEKNPNDKREKLIIKNRTINIE